MSKLRKNKITVVKGNSRARRWRAAAAGALSIAIALTGLTVTAAPANAAVVGACTMKANNPHASTHVSGTINAEGSMKCTIGMTEIYIQAYLEKSGGSSWAGNAEGWLSTPANKTYSSFANTSCSQGPATFRTRVTYSFTSPAGVNPSYSANTIYSPWYALACGLAARSASPVGVESAWSTKTALPSGVTMQATPDGVELTFGVQK